MNKSPFLLFISFVIINSFNSQKHEMVIKQDVFQVYLDSAQVIGSVLIFDPIKNIYYTNDFKWAKKGQLPASTFKIVNTIIAFETGVIENDSVLFKWDGKKHFLKSWEKDLILIDAFRASCVPCYKKIARLIGSDQMNEYLKKYDYGAMDVNKSNIDSFWLTGDSRITQFEQIAFLRNFYEKKLPINDNTYKMLIRMMINEKTNPFILSGKTGWSVTDDIDNGWFVGYAETADQVFYFATNIEPRIQGSTKMFNISRKNVTKKALSYLIKNEF